MNLLFMTKYVSGQLEVVANVYAKEKPFALGAWEIKATAVVMV